MAISSVRVWHHTRLLDPQRAKRLWERDRCGMAIVGGEAENQSPPPCFERLPCDRRVFSRRPLY
ncbi:hypothetical protein, partial [Oscillatoria salina]|uniref:hypothetical protein n=1 Tax=Oscillatoria salina TaxID=331517 RepID=UPI001CC99EAA